MRVWIGLGAAAIVAGLGAYWTLGPGTSRSNEPLYRTAKLDRGDITASVRATGTLNPVTTVLVGSQLSGQIIEIRADFNSPVKQGEVIARLFSDQIRSRRDAAQADLDQGRADLAQRRAQIARTKATRAKAEATLRDQIAQRDRTAALLAEARRTADRQRELTGRGVGSNTALDQAQTQVDTQTAQLASAEALIDVARAELTGLDADIALAEAQAEAAQAVITAREARLKDIEIDLARTDIRSPVDGVVIQKQIELGQTVAASLNAPTLFTIAQDLREIDIYANVDESDVGRIREGQPVTFTVNAYPERTYRGTVKMVRLSAQTVQNVVTYTTVISVANTDMTLLPGMTANLQIVTDQRRDVLRVPNAALRFRPAGASIAATTGNEPAASGNARPGGAGQALAELRERIAQEVKPTPEQAERIEAAIAAQRGQRGPGTDGASGADRRQAFAEARRRLTAEIAAILDPERRAAFEAMIARLSVERASGGAAGTPARLYTLGAAGEPQPVNVRLGVSDGVFTENVAGDLTAADAVVTGGGPRPQAEAPVPPRGPRGPRLF